LPQTGPGPEVALGRQHWRCRELRLRLRFRRRRRRLGLGLPSISIADLAAARRRRLGLLFRARGVHRSRGGGALNRGGRRGFLIFTLTHGSFLLRMGSAIRESWGCLPLKKARSVGQVSRLAAREQPRLGRRRQSPAASIQCTSYACAAAAVVDYL